MATIQKNRKYVPIKLRNRLLAKVDHRCQFCGSHETSIFEVHHADGDPIIHQTRPTLLNSAFARIFVTVLLHFFGAKWANIGNLSATYGSVVFCKDLQLVKIKKIRKSL